MKRHDIQPTGLAYSYIRMSTDQQIKGDSLRRQLELSRQWAARHSLTLDETLRDIGVSAYKGRNRKDGALGKFLAEVEIGRVRPGSYLLVESLDRLSRDQVLEALSLFLEIIRSGITIVTLADDQVYSADTVGNDWSKLIISLTIMARAHEESLRKSERLAQSYEARRQRAAEGKGKMTSICPGWLDATKIDRGKVIFTPNAHAITIQLIFELAAEGMSHYAINRRLNSTGVPTMAGRGNAWTQAFISTILNGRAVLGEYQPRKGVNGKKVPAGEPIAAYYPAVISEKLWQDARSLKRPSPMKGHEQGPNASPNKAGGRTGRGFGNLFTKMGRCAACGNHMTFHQSKAQYAYNQYLSCSSRRRGMGCSGSAVSFNYSKLETGILDNVREYMLSDIVRIKRENSPLQTLSEEIASLKGKIDDVFRREQSLVNQLEDAGDLAPMILTRLRERRDERVHMEEALRDKEHRHSEIEASIANPVDEDEIERMRRQWHTTEDMEERYALRLKTHLALRQFIDFIIFDPEHKVVTVVLLGGLRNYRFWNGALIDKIDFVGQLGSKTDGLIPQSVFTADGVTAVEQPERRAALLKILNRS